MNTDDLIRALSADTLRPPALRTTLMMWLLPAVAAAVLAVWLALGFRDDLAAAMITPVSLARLVLTIVLGVTAARLSLVLARPEQGPRARLWPLAAVGVAALALLALALVTTPAGARLPALMGTTATACLTAIPLLAILPVAALHRVLRRGATTVPAKAGFVAGLAGAGLAAAAYALHCPESSPLFYVTWSGLAIMGVASASALIGTRSLRW